MKENQRIAISKRMLREGLLRLLETKELGEINVTELCREAEINRTTFYKYYNTPHDVLNDIAMVLMNEMKTLYRMPEDSVELKKYVVQICAYMKDHAQLLRLLIKYNSDTELAMAISGIYENIREYPHPYIAWNLKDDESMQLAATFIGGGVYFLIRRWLMEDITKSPEEITDLVFAILTNGTDMG